MNNRRFGVWVLPGVVLIVVFLWVPLIRMILPSFMDGGLTLAHYRTFLTDPFYQGILWRSLKLSLLCALICLVLGLPAAFYISGLSAGKKRLAMAVLMFPLLTNAIIRGFAWMTILGKNGVISTVLQALKLVDQPISLMYTETAIVVGSVYLFLPLMINTLISVMDALEPEVLEAAQSLGARPRTSFFKIVIPLTYSGILLGFVLVFTGTLSAYTTSTLLGGNKNMMLATLLYQQATQLSNWTNAAMISLMMILLSAGVMWGMQLLRKKDGRAHA